MVKFWDRIKMARNRNCKMCKFHNPIEICTAIFGKSGFRVNWKLLFIGKR